VAGGLAMARASGSASLLASVRDAYTSGLDVMLIVCAAIALAAALLAARFLPRRPDQDPAPARPATREPGIAEVAEAE
jgi:hypothetical protein